jgi:hypothetical protein
MRIHYLFCLVLISLFTTACQEEIALDLPPNEPELVVEAYLVDLDFYIPDGDLDCSGITIIPRELIVFGASLAANFPIEDAESRSDYFPFKKVVLSSTADYFSNAAPPAVSDATVKLFENGILVEALAEDAFIPGTYRFTYNPVVDASYHLEIEALGNFYKTEAEVYRSVPPIINIGANFGPNFLQDSCAYYMAMDTYERPGPGDFYRWMFYVNDKFDNRPNFISIATDDGIDGFCLFGFDVYGDELELGDTVTVFQMAVSESYYNFAFALRSRTGQVGSPFDAPPSPITGNIKNITKNTNAHGYFAAGGVSANFFGVPGTIPDTVCP